ncbi:MAG: terpene cyclase/mutase family protein [Propionibacteriaceae bacterium]|nr:terpene cyclase/mutase family protein [Propionibacteriaceae bacterium]
MKTRLGAVGITTALFFSLFCFTIPGIAHADAVRGAACQPGQGVTVIVDYSPNGSDVEVRCAPGTWPSIVDAVTGAGFTVTHASGFVTEIDGVNPSKIYGSWDGYWEMFTSTTTGTAAGPADTSWTFAQIGGGDGPLKVDQAYLLRAADSWDCMMLDYDPTWELDDPSRCEPTPKLNELNRGVTVKSVAPATAKGSADAVTAVAWLGQILADNDDVIPGFSGVDWELTTDSIFALASAGVGGTQLSKTAAKLKASGSAYIGSSSEIGTRWARAAKVALALMVAGEDPTSFDGRNLLFEIRSVMNADGSFGNPGSDSSFNHSLAMLALARTDGGVPVQATQWILGRQCSTDGSFGWSSGCGGADIDMTAMVLQALQASGASGSPEYAMAEQWLISKQESSGGFSAFGAPNANSTGLGSQALHGNTAVLEGAVRFIGTLQVSCTSIEASTGKLTEADLGAIAYNPETFSQGVDEGIESSTSQFVRATVQAVLGLGGPGFENLTAEGIETDLPVRESCESDPPADPSSTLDPPTGNQSGADSSKPQSGANSSKPEVSKPSASTGGSLSMGNPGIVTALGFILMGVALRRWVVLP